MTETQQTMVEALAHWVEKAAWSDLSQEAITALKGRLLDSIGVAIGALEGQPIQAIRQMTEDLGGQPAVTLIGGGKTSPVNATFFNGAAIRYLDFNDSFLAKEETCHPSDNIAPVLAAAEYNQISGKQFLVALAIAYQVQTRLSEAAPVRKHGFDHTVQGAYGAAAGTARALGLDGQGIAQAIAIAGTTQNALRVTRTGQLSNWKGLAYPNTAMGAMHAAILAKYGITGPREVFEGNKGFMESIAGPFAIEWAQENYEGVTRTSIKKYNAEIHSQSAIEGILALKQQANIAPSAIKQIRLDTFDVAYNIIGGGEEGEKKTIKTKEEADHSLPYMLAAAFLDGQVMPEQYQTQRINRQDIQSLLQKVDVNCSEDYSARFPQEKVCKVTIETNDGQIFSVEKHDYPGFTTSPASWNQLLQKYQNLTKHIDGTLAAQIAETIQQIDQKKITDLTDLLAQINVHH